jgi:Zn finger protein HypA/HybF involved in hydrogenase expression
VSGTKILEAKRLKFYVTDVGQPLGRRLYLTAKTQSKINGSGAARATSLETVWEKLKDGEWESKAELAAACGEDADSLIRIISFLDRWGFVDVDSWPELRVRRKSNAISPMETFQLFRELVPTNFDRVIAKRIACRSCGSRKLRFIQRNQVECATCNEKQWYTVGREETIDHQDYAGIYPQPSLLERALIRLGRPQKAFRANIPRETQYFWFRCTNCGKTSADYPHGHSKYLTCPTCKSDNQYW